MKVIVAGRHMHVREELEEYAKSKLEKYEKYFDENIEVHLTFSYRDRIQIFEVTIPLKRGVVIRAEEEAETMEAAIDMALDKVGRQIRKHKSKLEDKYQSSESIRFESIPRYENEIEEEEEEKKIVKSKRFGIKPMDPEEAVLQMQLIGHDFFVFLNARTDEVNVVYTRKDGNFGLIEPYI